MPHTPPPPPPFGRSLTHLYTHTPSTNRRRTDGQAGKGGGDGPAQADEGQGVEGHGGVGGAHEGEVGEEGGGEGREEEALWLACVGVWLGWMGGRQRNERWEGRGGLSVVLFLDLGQMWWLEAASSIIMYVGVYLVDQAGGD